MSERKKMMVSLPAYYKALKLDVRGIRRLIQQKLVLVEVEDEYIDWLPQGINFDRNMIMDEWGEWHDALFISCIEDIIPF